MYQFVALLFCLSLWSCQGNPSSETSVVEQEAQAVQASASTMTAEEVAPVVEPAASVAASEKSQPKEVEPAPGSLSAKAVTTVPETASDPVIEEEGPEVPPNPSIATTTSETASPLAEEPIPLAQPDHSAWDALLQQFVSSTGKVNYAGLNTQKPRLRSYLDDLAQHPPQSDWSRQEAMAYWINAYNAFTIQLILDHYPVQSIRDIAGGQPWDKKWIQLGDQTYSLNQIENDILRPKYQDARIHFAVNCAAQSCPPLHNRAFTAANLNSTLERLTRQFVNNSSFNSVSENEVEVSKIFDWYGGDFGDLRAYLDRFTEISISAEAAIRFKEYNWALNN